MNESATAVRLRQGHAWIARLTTLECWTRERQNEADRLLDACPPGELDRVVEDFRARMQTALEAAGEAPCFARTSPGAQSGQPIKRRARGLARFLAHVPALSVPAESAKHEGRARDSPCVAVGPDNEDPHRIRCCESCAHWCRHPATGAGLCMAEPGTPDAMGLRGAWLSSGNALNRCAHFLRRSPAL